MISSRFDLTDLRLFLMVVEHGSLTRGAQAMNLALASASERISGMEDELGAPLLKRTRRGAQTTAAGDALVRHAHLILAQVEQMHGELHSYATGHKGRIRLLSNTGALAAFLPDRLCRFLTAYPDLSVDIEERPSAEIALALAERRGDLGIVADITDLTALQTHLIAHDQLLVVAGRMHRIGQRASVSFADIVGEAFVGLSDAALEIYLGEHASRLGCRINYRARVRSVEQMGIMIKSGVGIAILPAVFAGELRSAELSVVPLSEPWASRQLYLCARDFNVLPPQTKLLAQHLIEPEPGSTEGNRKGRSGQ